MRGRFIVFEGGEGAGKTTQTKRLAEWLTGRGVPCMLTREPGGRPEIDVGIAKIRSLLVEAGNHWEGLTEMLLFAAARHEHVKKVIEPALAAGTTVVCDRFSDSSLAYQGYGRDLGLAVCDSLRSIACGDLVPDLTVLIDVPVETGLARSMRRPSDATRFELEEIGFHERVRSAFLAIASSDPERYRVVDGRLAPEAVQDAVRTAVAKALSAG